MIQVSFWFKVR